MTYIPDEHKAFYDMTKEPQRHDINADFVGVEATIQKLKEDMAIVALIWGGKEGVE